MKPINDDDIRWLMEHPLEARALLLGDFCLFIRVFHFYMMRDQFILMPFHVELAKKLVAYVMGKNEKQNLYIGLSPRAGKSQLVIYFNAFAFGANPYSNFIYTSYSGDLCVKHSKKIRDIVESELFRKIFGIRIDPSTSAANLWKIQGGGEFRSVPMGGAITGFGCFGFNLLIKTDRGYIKLGDIVEKKLPVKVYSWGDSGIELVDILNYIKSEECPNITIVCNKDSIKTTKDHKYMTIDGWKEAKDLKVGDLIFAPNMLNHIFATIKFMRKKCKGVLSITNIRDFFLGKKPFIDWDIVPTALKSDADRFPAPLKPAFNIGNLPVGKIKRFGYKFIRSGINCDSTGDFWRYFGVSIMCAVLNAILFIVGLCPIGNIRNRIINFVAVKMSNNKSIRFAEKSKRDQFMSPVSFASTKADAQIAFSVNKRFKNFIRLYRKHFPRLGNIIARIMGYRIINNIIKNNHSKTFSYCLSTKNGNFLAGKSKLLVHNCGTFEDHFGGAILVDDFMKADDYRSDAEKQTCIEIFENTLKSRKNRPAKDPTIIIAQRLAKDDLVAYIKEKYPDEWDFYVIPAFNEETGESFWEDRYPKKWLLDMKEQNPFLFYSQYQQEPIAQGGGVIKHEWWRYYSDMNDHPYRRIFITADTANKTKEWNDYSAIGVWGFTQSRRLRLLDMVHAKLEIPELQSTLLALWDKWKVGIGSCRCSAIYVEDKASGTQVIQQLRRVGGLPIMPVIPEKDKLTRVLDVVPQIAAGNVELPESENHPLSKEFLAESDAFSADDSHAHDDMVDMMVMAVMQAFNQRGYF